MTLVTFGNLLPVASLRVVRIYHAGRVVAYRERERLLCASGVDLTLVVPRVWPEGGGETELSKEPFRVVELPVKRPGDVNRHSYADGAALSRVLHEAAPDVLDLHEEPFSAVARQMLRLAPAGTPVVMYTAQNVDKRYPPPFAQYERAAHRRVAALYPCSRQAAAVARGKGFDGLIEVLPLGYDPALFFAGTQSLDDHELVLALFGRLVPEKGLTDAVQVLAHLNRLRPARLVVHGSGPDGRAGVALAAQLGVADRLELSGWKSTPELAKSYRTAHIVLVPSKPTETWVEQFGRVIVEAQASGAVVAGYDSGTIAEVGGEAAVLAEPGASRELAAAVAQVVADETDWQRRRRLGLETVQHCVWENVSARHAALYDLVAGRSPSRVLLPRSPRERRQFARSEFGPTSATVGGPRPFALPVLRRDGPLSRALARIVDAAAETVARRS
jgi:glycosyltransferase involved in cell wall biosynthesis